MSMCMTDTPSPPATWTFAGVETLNGTQIPDAYFDEVMAPLGPSAFTVLMYVARRTFGFKRHSDQISLDQISLDQICHGIVTTAVRDADGAVVKPARRLDHGTGLAKSTVVRVIDRLIAAGLLRKRHNTDPRRGQLANTYGIVFKDASAATPTTPASPLLPDKRTVPRQEADTSPVPHEDTPCRAIAQAPVRERDTQQTVVTTNSRRQTDTSKRGARATRRGQPLDANDSTVFTRETSIIAPLLTETQAGPDASPLRERVARLAGEFGDDAPHASWTRVLNMQRAAGLDSDALLALLDEADAITRAQAPAITKRGRGGAIIRMPYLLATFRGLVETSADRPVGTPASLVTDAPTPSASDALDVPDADDRPAPTAAESLWRAVRAEVRLDLTPENYAAWFAPTHARALDGDVLRVVAPTPFHRQWLEQKLRGCVERALGRTGHGGVRVAYDIAPPEEIPLSGDQTARVDPAIAMPTLAPSPLPVTVPPSPVPPRETSAREPIPHPRTASITVPSPTVPSPVVACPACRAAPCQCRLMDRLRRGVATRRPPHARIGVL